MAPRASSAALGWVRWVSVAWFVLDAFTHVSMELSYVCLTHFYGGASHAPAWLSPVSFIWREYGLAYKRWTEFDPTVLSLELLTVFVAGPLAAACAYGVMRRASWRHLAVVVLCVMELYGGVMTFAPEWLARPVASPNLSGTVMCVAAAARPRRARTLLRTHDHASSRSSLFQARLHLPVLLQFSLGAYSHHSPL